MKLKRTATLALAAALVSAPVLAVAGCAPDDTIVLRVYNWEEYMDEGGEDSYDGTEAAPSMTERFEAWYEETYDTPIRVEYTTYGTNEDMYNQLMLTNEGDYDLLCPSEYMIMKLAAEDRLVPYDDSFFDPTIEENYYIRNVSPFIQNIFEGNEIVRQNNDAGSTWADYAAGYMWGVTGFIYNAEAIDETQLAELGWNAMTADIYKNKVTTKDNVRDTYFVALAILYRDEIKALDRNAENFNEQLTAILNRTDEETIKKVEEILRQIDGNIYSYETDTGKNDMVLGNIWLNFAWSGDAVYAMDLAEEEDGISLNFFIPNECANLWFDGWVMPKGANVELAQKFIDFLSRPENAVANMNFIGYTSAIAGDEVYEEMIDWYDESAEDTPGFDEDGNALVAYDLNYFFGGTGEYENYVIYVNQDSLNRQISAQYPTEEVIVRSAVMQHFDNETNAAVNEMWEEVKGLPIPVWAYIVIAVIAALIIVAALSYLYKGKRRGHKPKKGYKILKRGA